MLVPLNWEKLAGFTFAAIAVFGVCVSGDGRECSFFSVYLLLCTIVERDLFLGFDDTVFCTPSVLITTRLLLPLALVLTVLDIWLLPLAPLLIELDKNQLLALALIVIAFGADGLLALSRVFTVLLLTLGLITTLLGSCGGVFCMPSALFTARERWLLALVPDLTELDEGRFTALALVLTAFGANGLLAHVLTVLLLTLGLVFILPKTHWLPPLAVVLVTLDTSQLPPLATIVVPENCLLALAPVVTVPLLELTLVLIAGVFTAGVLIALRTTRLPECAVVTDENRLLAPAFVILALDVGTLFVLVNKVGVRTLL